MNQPTPENSIDWDAGLRALLEEHGIDPHRNAPLTKRQRRRRWLRKARGTIGATVAAVVASWMVVRSGAPAAAFMPLMAWFAMWLCRGYWRASGSPSARRIGESAAEHGKRIWTQLFRRASRSVWYPIVIRLRAQRLAKAQ
ncbi:hypothetical protein ACH498_25000 [Rhodococcus erythropolis]